LVAFQEKVTGRIGGGIAAAVLEQVGAPRIVMPARGRNWLGRFSGPRGDAAGWLLRDFPRELKSGAG